MDKAPSPSPSPLTSPPPAPSPSPHPHTHLHPHPHLEGIATLDRHTISCDSNQALTSYVLNGQCGSGKQYEYVCESATLSSTVSKTTNCEPKGNGKINNLDRHNVACDSGQVMTSFKVASCGGDNLKYEYTCGVTTLSGSKATLTTPCDNADNFIPNLDRHRIICNNGDLLQKFQLVNNGCSGDDKKYEFDCVGIAHPTNAPTASPTKAPTASPTKAPTGS